MQIEVLDATIAKTQQIIDVRGKELTQAQADLEALIRAKNIVELHNGGLDSPRSADITDVSRHVITITSTPDTAVDLPTALRRRRRKATGKMSIAEAARAALRDGAPLHVNDIVQCMIEAGVKTTKQAVTATLMRHAKRGEIFRKTGRNIFALLPAA